MHNTLAMAVRCGVLALVVAAMVEISWAADWPHFRGPNGRATSDAAGLPVTWGANAGGKSESEHGIAWKLAMPGPGSSSPFVIGDRVFITCYTAYGVSRDAPGNMDDLQRHLLCIDRKNGKTIWAKAVPAAQPEAAYVDFMPQHGYATSTPACDGTFVYAMFGKSGVFAFDLEGHQVWQADIGTQLHSWGVGASPMVHGDLLIVNAAIESASILALNKRTGEQVWKAKNLFSSWSTPVVAQAADGKPELVVSVLRKLIGLDLATGELLWSHKTTHSHCSPSPIAAGDMLYAVDSGPSRLLAVRAGSRGKLEDEQLAWTAANVGAGVSSPVMYGEYIYTVERGVVACVKAASGEIVYRQRLSGGGMINYASPVAADGKLYIVSRDRGTFVVAAGPEFKELAVNRFQGDDSVFNGTPALGDGWLLLRSDRYLYCVGKLGSP